MLKISLDLKWQGVTRLNHSGRPIGPRLPGRGEISSTRIATISNETLQSFSAASLSGMLNAEKNTIKKSLNIIFKVICRNPVCRNIVF